jgi:hypothetical protein
MKPIITSAEVKSPTGVQNLAIDAVFENSINMIFRKNYKVHLDTYFDVIWTKLKDEDYPTNLTNDEADIVENLSVGLAHFIVADNIIKMSVKISNKGAVSFSSNEYNNISISDMKVLSQEYEDIAKDYLTQFVDYLQSVYFADDSSKVNEKFAKNLGGFVFRHPSIYREGGFDSFFHNKK